MKWMERVRKRKTEILHTLAILFEHLELGASESMRSREHDVAIAKDVQSWIEPIGSN